MTTRTFDKIAIGVFVLVCLVVAGVKWGIKHGEAWEAADYISRMKAKDAQIKPEEIATEVTDKKQKDIRHVHLKMKLYDISYVVYSQEFADTYGYPQEHVAPLDPGMAVLGFDLQSMGTNIVMDVNVLLKQGIGLDFPKEADMVQRNLQVATRFLFPKKAYQDTNYTSYELEDGKLGKKRSDYEGYYQRNIHVGTADYQFRKQGGLISTMLIEYSKNAFAGYDYVKVYVGTYANSILQEPNPTLWFKKVGGDNSSMNVKAKDSLIMNIPRKLIDKILPWAVAAQEDMARQMDLEGFLNKEEQEEKDHALYV